MRKKLIELLDDIQLRGEDFTDYEIYGMRLPNTVSNDDVADHLIANNVVPVVRCKECKSWEQYNACDGTKPHRCMNHDAIFYKITAPNDFCSYGERKDNG